MSQFYDGFPICLPSEESNRSYLTLRSQCDQKSYLKFKIYKSLVFYFVLDNSVQINLIF